MRAALGGAIVALTVAVAAPAAADPAALRHAGAQRGWVVEGGWSDITGAWWVRPNVGVGVDVGVLGLAVGVSVGVRKALVDGPRGWGVDVFLAAGLRALFWTPGVAATLTPAIAAGSRGAGIATVGVALPASGRLGSGEASLPVLIEVRLGGRPGPVAFGVRGALGPVFATGAPVGAAMRFGVWFTMDLPVAAPGAP